MKKYSVEKYGSLGGCITAERDDLQVENKCLKDLLRIVRCPDSNCDNKGTITSCDENGEAMPEPCQWCFERDRLLIS